MSALPDSSTLSEVLRCVEEFEKLTGSLYEALSERARDRFLSMIFKWVSAESFNHAMFMRNLLDFLDVPRSEPDCSLVIGEPWRTVSELLKEISEARLIDLKVISNMLPNMLELEGFVGEETYNKLLYPALNNLLNNIISKPGEERKAELVSSILREVIIEEEYHEKLIKLVSELFKD